MDVKNRSFSQRLHDVIPGGAHTYSRGDDQFPENAPEILEKASGAYVFDTNKRKFLDYGMALRAVSIGYSEPSINAAAFRGIELGNGFTRPSTIELEAAELLCDRVKSVDMVKFTKNGSNATSAAVKLARAYTGKTIVLRCAEHPFFSFDDWFIGSTQITRGIPTETINQTKLFSYNDMESLRQVASEQSGNIACVIMEPVAAHCPKSISGSAGCCGKSKCTRIFPEANFLKQVQDFCKSNDIIFILDETITGFRWSIGGAQEVFGIEPDITTFGKAMSNGFSVAAVGGKKDIMELGSILGEGDERLFLLSTTHGAEMSGLAAFIETVNFIESNSVIPHLWKYGGELIEKFNVASAEIGIFKNLFLTGPAPNPILNVLDDAGLPWFELRTLFLSEMIKHGILMPWISISYRHTQKEMDATLFAVNNTMRTCVKAIHEGIEKYYDGRIIKPVFRKFN